MPKPRIIFLNSNILGNQKVNNMLPNDKERIILSLRKEHVFELERLSKAFDLTKSQLIGQMLAQVLPHYRSQAKDIKSANAKMVSYGKIKK